MSESTFRKKVCSEIVKHNGYVTPYVASRRGKPGTPDAHVIHAWWSGWIEFKGADTAIRKDQVVVMREMNKRRPMSAIVLREGWHVENESGEVLQRVTGILELFEWLHESG